jgi:hypothetical protein
MGHGFADPAPQPDAPKPQADEAKPKQSVPLVGLGGKVVRRVDALEQDADRSRFAMKKNQPPRGKA